MLKNKNIITNGMKEITVFTEEQMPLIKKLFSSDMEKFLEISHFSVIIIAPNKEAYIASASKNFSASYKEHDFHKYDNTMCPLMHENLDFYTWAEGYIKIHQSEIAEIKKEYKLNNGAVFVRRIDSYTILYCVATKKEDTIMKTIFVNHANSILKLGDYFYNELRSSFEENAGGIILPKIKIFKPFLDEEIPSLASFEVKRKTELLKIMKDSKSINQRHNLKIIVNNTKIKD